MNPNFNPEDGLVDKYHVFRSPPVEVTGTHASYEGRSLIGGGAISGIMQEVDAFVFVLKPNNDHHARVALAAYAASCAITKPQLSRELYGMLDDGEWGKG